MIKPALPYLDVIRRARDEFGAPIAAYNVSGEYAMLKAAAERGWLDERRAVLEVLTSIKRGGPGPIVSRRGRTDWLVTQSPMTRSEELFARARAASPGGVDSGAASVRWAEPAVHRPRRGRHVEDAGKPIARYVQSWGAVVRHARPRSWLLAPPSRDRSARRPSRIAPGRADRGGRRWNGSPVSSRQAAMTADLAQGGRPCGRGEGYHGHTSPCWPRPVRASPRWALPWRPASAGRGRRVVLPYNDTGAVRRSNAPAPMCARDRQPIAANLGVVLPTDGFRTAARPGSGARYRVDRRHRLSRRAAGPGVLRCAADLTSWEGDGWRVPLRRSGQAPRGDGAPGAHRPSLPAGLESGRGRRGLAALT